MSRTRMMSRTTMIGVFLSVPRYNWCAPLSHPVCLWIMDPQSRAAKKNMSHGNEVLMQDAMHLIQRPCYQRGSLCQDQADNWTTWRPDHRKEMQTEVVWTCLLFIRSGQNILQDTVKGGRKHGRQKKRWEDNIKEWTWVEFARSKMAVENPEKWRKLVVLQLRDRWRWRVKHLIPFICIFLTTLELTP